MFTTNNYIAFSRRKLCRLEEIFALKQPTTNFAIHLAQVEAYTLQRSR